MEIGGRTPQEVRSQDALSAGVRRPAVAVQPFAHFLAGLEERHALLIDRHMGWPKQPALLLLVVWPGQKSPPGSDADAVEVTSGDRFTPMTPRSPLPSLPPGRQSLDKP